MLRDVLTGLPGFATWPCDEINLVWRHGNRDHPSDELAAEHAPPRGARLRPRAGSTGSARKYDAAVVVEKTCANSLRVEFVRAGEAGRPLRPHHPRRPRRGAVRDGAVGRAVRPALHRGQGSLRPADRPARTTAPGSSPTGSRRRRAMPTATVGALVGPAADDCRRADGDPARSTRSAWSSGAAASTTPLRGLDGSAGATSSTTCATRSSCRSREAGLTDAPRLPRASEAFDAAAVAEASPAQRRQGPREASTTRPVPGSYDRRRRHADEARL